MTEYSTAALFITEPDCGHIPVHLEMKSRSFICSLSIKCDTQGGQPSTFLLVSKDSQLELAHTPTGENNASGKCSV